MASPLYIAVDLGAGSGRVFLAGVGPGEMLLEEIRRFYYPLGREDGHLRWNFSKILSEIKAGLQAAGMRAGELGRTVQSLGIDSWAVDYGLLDANGRLIANPVCYRDDRTTHEMEKVFQIVPRAEIFEKTGIQFLNFNTLFQLYSDLDLDRAETVLLIPDLVNYFLTGRTFAECTNATTTQMINAATGKWDSDLLQQLNLRETLLPEIIPAGSDIGPLRPELEEELGLRDVHVVAPATHDTGSAVAAAPLGRRDAFISSGTWSLIGVERSEPLINDEAAHLNFTNEGGAYGTIRFLKNVMGLWIFESCRSEWIEDGIDAEYDTLVHRAAEIRSPGVFIYPDDESFLNPERMLTAIASQLAESGQECPSEPAAICRVIFDSLAYRYASVLRMIETLTGEKVDGIHILGGGGRNRYLNQMTANASGVPVSAGLTEATVVGNVLVQAIADGRFGSLADARGHVAANIEFENYFPQRSGEIEREAERYARVEHRFTANAVV